MLSIFLGGTRNPELINESDKELTAIVLKEITQTLHTDKKPDLIRVSRYLHAIPQYGKIQEKIGA